jgi:hypothetical protein
MEGRHRPLLATNDRARPVEDAAAILEIRIPEYRSPVERLRHNRGEFYALVAAVAAVAQVWVSILTLQSSHRESDEVPQNATSSGLTARLLDCRVQSVSRSPMRTVLAFGCRFRIEVSVSMLVVEESVILE